MSGERDATETIIAAQPMDGKDSEGDYRPSHVARAEATTLADLGISYDRADED